jgi:uncharacterized protein YodC (DUF2158 family)
MKIGDVVQLKSGGPEMTVVDKGASSPSDVRPPYFKCVWFDGANVVTHSFPEEALDTIKRPSKGGFSSES